MNWTCVLAAGMATWAAAATAETTVYTVPEPQSFWRDGATAKDELRPGERSNDEVTVLARDTGIVPKAGGFTAAFTFRPHGCAPYPAKMGWRNGMLACCRSGYYDGWRVHMWGTDSLRPCFEIGRAEGGVGIESDEPLDTNVWYRLAVTWEPRGDDPAHGTAKMHINGHLVAMVQNRPAPLLDGSHLKLGYVDYGVGALKFDCASVMYSDRPLSDAELRADFLADERCRGQKPQDVDPLLAQVYTRAMKLLRDRTREPEPVARAGGRKTREIGPETPGGLAAALRAAGEPGAAKRIVLRPGRYYLDETVFVQGAAFDGLEIEGAGPAGSVVVTGGRTFRLADFGTLSASERMRFPEAVRDRVVGRATDMLDAMTSYGVGESARRGAMLYGDGGRLEISRWPKGGDYPPVTFAGESFRFVDPSAPRIPAGVKFLVQGYWKYFWADAALPVEVQPDGSFKLLQKHGYGIGEHPIAAMLGVPEALSEPGEWCYADGKLYVYPPEGMTSVTVPVASRPFLDIQGTREVTIANVTFADATGGALKAQKAPRFELRDCVFTRLGGDAVIVRDSPRALVWRCTFDEIGHTELALSGGDRRTLEPGEALVQDCRFAHSGRLQRTYTPGVLLEGCGGVVRGCTFTMLPSSAMRVEGNDHIVRDCTFTHTVRESDDQGSIDIWGDPTYRGSVFFNNDFRDIGGGGGTNACGRAAIRFDDMISGMAVISNRFMNTAEGHFGAVQIHAGHYNALVGNTFDASARGVTITRWGDERWRKTLDSDEVRRKREVAESGDLYRSRYPEYSRLMQDHCRQLILNNVYVPREEADAR